MILEISDITGDWQWRLIDHKGRIAAASVLPHRSLRKVAGAFYDVADGLCAHLVHFAGENVWIYSDYEDHRMTRAEFVKEICRLYKRPMVGLCSR